MTRDEVSEMSAAIGAVVAEKLLRQFQVIPMLTLDQTAEALGVSHEKVRQLVDSGELPHIRLNKLYRIRPADVNAYLEKHMVAVK